jgi:hypothetical protein
MFNIVYQIISLSSPSRERWFPKYHFCARHAPERQPGRSTIFIKIRCVGQRGLSAKSCIDFLSSSKKKTNDDETMMRKVCTLGVRKKLSPVVEPMRFVIHNFAKIKHFDKKGDCIHLSDNMWAHGHLWTLLVYPHGEEEEDDNDNDNNARTAAIRRKQKKPEYVSIFLECHHCKAGHSLDIECFFQIGSKKKRSRETFKVGSCVKGWSNFIEREKLLDPNQTFLDQDGTLVIDIELRIYVKMPSVWYPPMLPTAEASAGTTTTTTSSSSSSRLLADLYKSGRCSDVTFQVGHEKFHLHRFNLDYRATVLSDMIPPAVDDQTIIVLDDKVDDVEMFRIMVRYIYTEEWPTTTKLDLKAAKALLTTANRFGCRRLKLWIESVLVDKFLDEHNAADLLLLGDSHHCALLKEAAMKLLYQSRYSGGVVRNTEGWQRVKESALLLEELFFFSAGQHASDDDDDTNGQSVAELRDRLLKRGRDDVDGSREMLVKRLKETHE